MKHITYNTSGTCSKVINLTIDDDNRIQDVSFVGGCNGNIKGVCSLVMGMKAEEVKKRLQGIICGNKGTSCPDQLSKAIDMILNS
ncbi:MAG: TIGR03905 family TSCPD domain-containing protein [Prevotellaceae bacterium]|nr:TIGR03905 family TSCPD domain-containing protein [Prevotellaceae bacterium]